eukprot:gene29097-36176_t
MVTCLDPFTRAQQIIVQCNCLVVMLVITLWFYYSKSHSCCVALKRHMHCPEPVAPQSECRGTRSCSGLIAFYEEYGTEADVAHLHAYACGAFPQSTLMHRLYGTGLLVLIKMSMVFFFQTMFTIGAMNGTTGLQQRLENVVYLVTTALVDTRLIARAVARYLVWVLRILEWLLKHAQRLLARLGAAVHRLALSCHFLWQYHLRGVPLAQLIDQIKVEITMAGRPSARIRRVHQAMWDRANTNSVPPELWEVINPLDVESVWATLCAVALYRRLPYHWVDNWKDPPAQQVSLEDRAEDFLKETAVTEDLDPGFLLDMREQATACVQKWHEDHLQLLRSFREQVVKEKTPPAGDDAELAEGKSLAAETGKLTRFEKRRQLRARVAKFLRSVVAAHPWARI